MSANKSLVKPTRRSPPRRRRIVLATPSKFEAVWEGVFEGYTAKYLRANLWRVSRTCDMEDAMQEARIVFLRCSCKYKDSVDNAAWFMSIYKRSLAARFSDLSTKDTRYRQVAVLHNVQEDEEGGALPLQDTVGEVANAGELCVALRQAPSEVVEVLTLLLGAPAELLELAADAWRSGGKRGAFGNSMLNRLLGREPSHQSLEQVQEYFK